MNTKTISMSLFWSAMFVFLIGCSTSRDLELLNQASDSVMSKAVTLYLQNGLDVDGHKSFFLYKVPFEENGLVGVSVSPSQSDVLVNDDIVPGTYGLAPSVAIEREGKLFYWHNNDVPLTEQVLNLLYSYDLVEYDPTGLKTMPTHTINDSRKATHYFFCVNGKTVYRRRVTSIGLGYYNPPRINCSAQ